MPALRPPARLRAPARVLALLVAVCVLLGLPLTAGPASAAATAGVGVWHVRPQGSYRATTRSVAYADPADAQRTMDVVTPVGAPPGRPVVVLLHGGGYYRGDRSTMTTYAFRLASSGYVVVNVDYRLSTRRDGAWPAQRTDLERVLAWVREHAAPSQVDPTRIGVLGVSAGGHLALFASGMPGVRAISVWSPMLDPYDVAYRSRAGTGLALQLIQRTARCTYARCPTMWTRTLRPIGFSDNRGTAPIHAVNSSDELIDERPLLAYAGRVRARGGAFDVTIVPGTAHADGARYDRVAWAGTVAHFARYL